MEAQGQHRQLIKTKKTQDSSFIFNQKAISLTIAVMFTSGLAKANPTGGEFAAGVGAISSTANLTTIHQTSDRAIVNWQSFGSNAGEVVKFVQPSANSAILNRVVGDLPSKLNGMLEANGRVYLINPNGIMLGQDGIINANGGFVASTHDVNNKAFMQGGALVFTGESSGSIQILGKIQSAQGDIILIAPKTEIKQGALLEAGQSIKLVAANEVELSNGKITVKPKANDAGQITLEGALQAAQVELKANSNNLGALAINSTGVIHATGTQINPDGSVSIVATGEGGNINIAGNIRSEKGDGNGGAVTVLADNAIRVNGNIVANSANAAKKGGDIVIGRDTVTVKLTKATDVSGATLLSNKGLVETSGQKLKFDGVAVFAKDWLLDPFNVNIDAAAASTISSNLANTDITIETTTGASIGTNTPGDGNITVNGIISKQGSVEHTLTLNAANGIDVYQSIGVAAGAGKLNVNMTALGNAAMAAARKGIALNKVIDANGGVVTLSGTNLNTAGNSIGIIFNHGSGITAAYYDVKGVSTSLATGSYGVGMFGMVKFKSTGNSLINGTSLAQQTALTYGTMIADGANVSFDAGNLGGKLIVKGSNAAWETGLRISASGGAATVTTDGNVTLGALEDKSQLSFRAGTITANSGSLTLLGKLLGGGTAVSTYDGASIVANNGVSISIEGVATGSATAVGLGQNTSLNIKTVGGGDIIIKGTANTGNAVNIGVGGGAVIQSSGKVTVVGNSTAATGINIAGALQTDAGSAIIGDAINIAGTGGSGYAGVYLTGKVINNSNGGATTIQSSNSNINFASATAAVTNASTAGTININATGGASSTSAITSTSGATITQNANADVLLSTDGKGNLTPAKIIKNDAGAGNVTIAAGKLLPAGDATGGQILTNSSTTIANSGTGKVYLYSGKASSTGMLSNFGNGANNYLGLNALKIDGSAQQNADTNVAYNPNSLGISGSSAAAQVMFREKVTIANDLVGATLAKTYGDASTVSTASAVLLAEAKTKLKQETANLGNYTTAGANSITIAKSVVIDSLTGNLSNAVFSTSGYLKANTAGYIYSALSSSKYVNAGMATNQVVKVTVDKLALTGLTIDSAFHTYGDAVSAGLVRFTSSNLKSGDLVGGLASVQSTPLNFSASNNLSVGFYAQKVTRLTNGNANNDADNYSFNTASVTSNYEVKKKRVTLAASGNTTFYNGSKQTDTITNSGLVAGDNVDIVGAGSGTQFGSYRSNLALSGSDAANYAPSITNADFRINENIYYHSSADALLLTPVSFGFAAMAAATAAGEPNEGSCDAWSQRVGAGSVSVVSLLKSSYMGLRNAKTDTMDALNGVQATSASVADSSCASTRQSVHQASL